MKIVAISMMIFWLALFVIVWTYFGYFLVLWLLSLFRTREIKKEVWFPAVSLIITAHNEERQIRQKIENTLTLSYPREKLEIIVVSDGSTDSTVQIVKSFQDQDIKLLAIPDRHGKHYGQGKGIAMAQSDIIVLTDTTTFLDQDAVTNIICNFADPEVGCVSGVDCARDDQGGTTGEIAYVKYEMKLRTMESRIGSLVGVSGCFFAVRKHLCGAWIDNMSSDFYMPIITCINGLRAVIEHKAIGYYKVLGNPTREFERKVRTIVHGLEVLFHFKDILNPFKYGGYSLKMISHKLCRWLVPLALILVFLSNLFLLNQSIFYQITFAAQLLLYLLALIAFIVKKLQGMLIFKIPFFFVMANLSILVAWYKYLANEKYLVWDPTKR